MSLPRLIYTILLYLLLPVILLRMLWRGRANSAYWLRWQERFGFVKISNNYPIICLHAVSVGETMAAKPLIERLLADYPEYLLVVTSTTPTGSDTVKRLFGDKVVNCYFPYDLPGSVRRFLERTKPELMLIMETELWPNFFAGCKNQYIPLLLVNARLSERSCQRYQKIMALTDETLQAVTCVLARTKQDSVRFTKLGMAENRIKIAGDIKFEGSVESVLQEKAVMLRASWQRSLVWCAGSSHAGEELLLLEIHQQLRKHIPDLLLILVPRHPERFNEVANLCKQSKLPTVRRSLEEPVNVNTAVLLGDTMGELVQWYACSDVAFVGGSLVEIGGHNPLEALRMGVPVITGPHISNFVDMYQELEAANCARRVESTGELQDHLLAWFKDETSRLSSGQAGSRFLRENSGVTECLMQAVQLCLQNEITPNKKNNKI